MKFDKGGTLVDKKKGAKLVEDNLKERAREVENIKLSAQKELVEKGLPETAKLIERLLIATDSIVL